MALAAYTVREKPVDGPARRVEYHASAQPGVEYERVVYQWDGDKWRPVGRELLAELRLTASVGDAVGAEEVYE